LGRGGGGDRPAPFSLPRPNPVTPSCNSYADLGLRPPAALGSDDGAEDAVGRAGKTNGGLGVGPEPLNMGGVCPVGKNGEDGERSSSEARVYAFPIVMAGSWLNEYKPRCSEAVAAAMLNTAALRPQGGRQLD